MKYVLVFSLTVTSIFAMESERNDDASKYRTFQLNIQLIRDKKYGQEQWQEIDDLLMNFEKQKQQGNFNLDMLLDTVTKMYNISLTDKGIWGDAQVVRFLDSEQIDEQKQ